MNSAVFVVILAVLAYICFRPTTFSLKNDIFIYRLPEEVYEVMSNMKMTVEEHSTPGATCTLLSKRTRRDGIKEKLFLVEKSLPLFWNYEIPLSLHTRLSFIEKNKELHYGFAMLRGHLLKLEGRLTFESRKGKIAPGCLLTEELTITCPWIAKTFVERTTGDSHKESLISIRNGLEGLYMPTDDADESDENIRSRDTEKVTKKEDRDTTRTDKRKDNKDKTTIEDEVVIPDIKHEDTQQFNKKGDRVTAKQPRNADSETKSTTTKVGGTAPARKIKGTSMLKQDKNKKEAKVHLGEESTPEEHPKTAPTVAEKKSPLGNVQKQAKQDEKLAATEHPKESKLGSKTEKTPVESGKKKIKTEPGDESAQTITSHNPKSKKKKQRAKKDHKVETKHGEAVKDDEADVLAARHKEIQAAIDEIAERDDRETTRAHTSAR